MYDDLKLEEDADGTVAEDGEGEGEEANGEVAEEGEEEEAEYESESKGMNDDL